MMFINKTEGVLGIIARRLSTIEDTTDLAKDIVYGKIAYFNSERSHLSKATALNQAEGRHGFAACRIHIASQDTRQDYLGLMINKNSWFKEQMNDRIRWLRAYGIIKHLYLQFNKPGCRLQRISDRKGSSNSLTMRQLQGIWWVWMVGVTSGMLIVSIEFLSNRFNMEGIIDFLFNS
ncbi:uncharacterized protein LOC135114500 [Scylla paramamosain]|uniref:uncharacterized protein LOC135114500 n=1 Tax=Scylla paramamosain TaxID=85552 RepID=UPI0030827BD2